MNVKETVNLIKKYGRCKQPAHGRTPAIYSAVCQKCGKEILTDGPDLNDVGYSVTRRGTASFWHESCKGDVWNSRIKVGSAWS